MISSIKNITIIFAVSLALLLLPSCTSGETPSNVIDIDSAETAPALMSDNFESIEYIPLETSEDCFIGWIQNLQVMDDFIVVISSEGCLVFDRQTGKFIRKVGMEGNGPNEYNSIVTGHSINEEKKTLLAAKASGAIEYSLIDGSVVEPGVTIKGAEFSIGKYMYIADDVWAKGVMNYSGDSRNQLYFFDNDKLIDSIANTSFYENKSNSFLMDQHENLFYRYNDNTHYKSRYVDTIFNITNKKLEPKWILKTQHSASKIGELRGDIQRLNKVAKNHYSILNIHETDGYLLFNSWFEGNKVLFLYSKDKQQLVKVDNEGFINDIDGGMVFWPTYTTSNQEAVAVYQAHKFLEDIDTTKASEQLKSLVSGIKEEHNPIIVIAQPRN